MKLLLDQNLNYRLAAQPLFVVISCAAAVILLLRILRGWRSGFARQMAALLGVVLAYAAAVTGGPLLGSLLRPFVTLPDFALAGAAGAVLALVVYNVTCLTGALLFKRTRDQPAAGRRLFSGTGGACIGGLIGLLGVWLMFTGLRLCGAIAEGREQAVAHRPGAPINLAGANGADERQPFPRNPSPGVSPAASETLGDRGLRALSGMKESIERGPLGPLMSAADPLPPAYYTNLTKLGRLVSDPMAMARFRDAPAVRELCRDPRIAALSRDPAIVSAIEKGTYLMLLQNPKVVAAINDPRLAPRLRAFNFGQAMDEALR